MEYTQKQLSHAVRLTVDDLMNIGYVLDELAGSVQGRYDEFVDMGIDTMYSIISTRAAGVKNMDIATAKRLIKLVDRLHNRMVEYDNGCAIGLVDKIDKIIRGDE